VSPGWRERWFRESGTDRTGEPVLRAVPELRAHVLARQLNLLDMLRFDQAFEYIFCRNVFMYFDRPTQRRVLGMLLHNLRPDGILFMGQSENLFGLSDGLVSPSPGEYWRK
jgi:chemotaxis methyl-accepting protein methylase